MIASTLKGQRGKGGGGIGPEETMVVGALQTHQTPNGHGMAGVNDQAVNAGHVVADTLTSGSHPGSNMPGRRREDDTNIVLSFDAEHSNQGNPSEHAVLTRKLRRAVSDASGVRRLTPVECERLQALPDGWTAPEGVNAPDSRRYAALGDAVTASVAEWIGRRLMAYECGLEAVA